MFKDVGFAINVETKRKIVNSLDITFNLSIGRYRPYKKRNYFFKSSTTKYQAINKN